MDETWPLVGRDAERAAIDDAFARPDVGGVVLVGDPGVGLTRLAREALRWLAPSSRHADWVAAVLAPDAVPFGAVTQLLPARTRPDGHPMAVLEAAARRFAALGGRSNAVIVVDDAHRLDPLSATLLAQLAVRSLAFVMLTARRGPAVPERCWRRRRSRRRRACTGVTAIGPGRWCAGRWRSSWPGVPPVGR